VTTQRRGLIWTAVFFLSFLGLLLGRISILEAEWLLIISGAVMIFSGVAAFSYLIDPNEIGD
jgi:1,4-dihydroxy-2-naphthoate octaprenyltransferase